MRPRRYHGHEILKTQFSCPNLRDKHGQNANLAKLPLGFSIFRELLEQTAQTCMRLKHPSEILNHLGKKCFAVASFGKSNIPDIMAKM